jgi:hypothetical protein
MNPAPDADLHSVGRENFEWVVQTVADLAVKKAKSAPPIADFRWGAFLGAVGKTAAKKAPAKKKPAAKKKSTKSSDAQP